MRISLAAYGLDNRDFEGFRPKLANGAAQRPLFAIAFGARHMLLEATNGRTLFGPLEDGDAHIGKAANFQHVDHMAAIGTTLAAGLFLNRNHD